MSRNRKEFPAKVRRDASARANGHCEKCGAKLQPGRFAYDHIVPDGLGGEPTLDNCQVLCSGGRATCHGIKTAEEDVPVMRKADAQKKAQNGTGAVRRPIPSPPRMKREPRRLAASLPPLQPKRMFR